MIKLIAPTLLIAASLTGCASIEAYNDNIQQTAVNTIQPTKAEYDVIIKRASTESVEDPHHAGKSWLLVHTNDKSGKKVYVNTRLVTHNKNTASGYVKTLNTDQSYKIDHYRFFCYQGYAKKQWGHSYTADHKKKLQIPGFGPGDDYDRRPFPSEEPFGKVICALGGFYQGSTDQSQ